MEGGTCPPLVPWDFSTMGKKDKSKWASSISLFTSNSPSAKEEKMGDCRRHLEGNVSLCGTSGCLIQRMSFGRVTRMTWTHPAPLPTRGPRPTLDISLPPMCHSSAAAQRHKSLTRDAQWRALSNEGRLFHLPDVIFPSLSFSFFVFHYWSFARPAAATAARLQKVKSKRSMTPKRQTATLQQPRLCRLNWHAASTSLCQSNKLMLSGIDCLLLMVAGFHASHWGN